MKTTTMFPLGQIVITPTAFELLTDENISPESIIQRHVLADWSEMTEHDKKANQLALDMGGRILSSYKLPKGAVIWITTDPERTATTIMLPHEE